MLQAATSGSAENRKARAVAWVAQDGDHSLRLRDSYDVPKDVATGPHSPAFAKFLWNWFGDPMALSRGEIDLSFLEDLTPEEISLARQLIRRNLRLNQNHIIEGASALHDVDAVPILREMLCEERSTSRRLTIAGALWKIRRDPLFVACLEEARSKSVGKSFGYVHLLQILWLENERAVDLLIGLLDTGDKMTQDFTLGLLNELEFAKRMAIPANQLRHQHADYRKLRVDPAFRSRMVAAMRQHNAQSKNGW